MCFNHLVKISLRHLNPILSENDIFPRYTTQTYAHYEEAILHMKKDRANLDFWINDLARDIIHLNRVRRNK
jgi:hypothetical protein